MLFFLNENHYNNQLTKILGSISSKKVFLLSLEIPKG